MGNAHPNLLGVYLFAKDLDATIRFCELAGLSIEKQARWLRARPSRWGNVDRDYPEGVEKHAATARE